MSLPAPKNNWAIALPRNRPPSLLAKEKVRQEIRNVLIEFVLGRQQNGLVVDEQQQEVKEKEQHYAEEHCDVSRNAVFLRRHAVLAVQWLQKIAEARPDAITLGQWVTLQAPLAAARREVGPHLPLRVMGAAADEAQRAKPSANEEEQHGAHSVGALARHPCRRRIRSGLRSSGCFSAESATTLE
eukprot:CAMPEP_0117509374 /NCGR_PEP_ID=MMETSP0784-20121206/27441_1 /TAXON_ID=39447 /ORGANISM="" /LENGTH=184 /DNA_ID=CAMNT_0005304977 /DNA_START=73 /DNA_END=624 /DNA_ORIENTATION=-